MTSKASDNPYNVDGREDLGQPYQVQSATFRRHFDQSRNAHAQNCSETLFNLEQKLERALLELIAHCDTHNERCRIEVEPRTTQVAPGAVEAIKAAEESGLRYKPGGDNKEYFDQLKNFLEDNVDDVGAEKFVFSYTPKVDRFPGTYNTIGWNSSW